MILLQASFVHIVYAKLGQASAGAKCHWVKLMMKYAPEWVRTSDPVIRNHWVFLISYK